MMLNIFKKKNKQKENNKDEVDKEIVPEIEEKVQEEEKPAKPVARSGYVNGNRDDTNINDETPPLDEDPKKKHEQLVFLIALFTFLLVVVMAIVLYGFDVGHIRTKLGGSNNVQKSNMASNDMSKELMKQQQAIEEQLMKATEKEDAQAVKEQELAKLKNDLEAKEKALADATVAAAAAAAAVTPAPTAIPATPIPSPMGNNSLASVVKIFENMETAQAAKRISAMDLDAKVDIINTMKKTKAAEILALMDTKESAIITTAIIRLKK
ncbi:MAG: hypothetical protein H7Y41_00590 [Hyphomonadaceae bacterium]|nr:hypothetical protein [Clostridia bacterium]